MKTITISVPDEEIKALEEFLYQSNIRVIEEKEEDDIELMIFEIEQSDENEPHERMNLKEMERAFEKEIWKLHHFGE